MLRLLGFVVLCLLLVGGLGLYFGWFTVSASNIDKNKPDIHLTVNKGKFQEDMHTVNEEAHSLFGEKTIKGTIHQIEATRQELTIHASDKQDVTLTVDATTKIKGGDQDSSFGDLHADDPVSVGYEAKKDGNVARTITVSKKL